MLTSIDVKFIFDSARLGLFSSANILWIADAALRVVFMQYNVRHFCFHKQNNSTAGIGRYN